MRGTVAKRLRRLGLRSGPRAAREIRPGLKEIPPGDVIWHRSTALIPNPVIEALAEAKRRRRRDRNLRVLGC